MPALPWSSAWQEALYGEHGFYRAAGGPAAHFATSAQGIPGGGRLLAAALVRLMSQHGLGTLVDLGCGRGELLRHVRELSPATGTVGVDVVARPEDLDEATAWVRAPGGARLPEELDGLEGTLLLAHEWLDVVPCTIGEVDDHGLLREVLVDPASGAERLGGPLSAPDLRWCERHWTLVDAAPGARVEVGLSRDMAWADAVGRLRSGVALAVDYGHRDGARPTAGTLTAYRQGRQVRPVPDGSCDLTAHVAMDTLEHDELVDQRTALHRLGIRGGTPPHELARRDPAAYLAALAESSAATALTATGGLGDFLWTVRRVG